jgi:membrane-associated protease RseP (regulator of RpoE activity)
LGSFSNTIGQINECYWNPVYVNILNKEGIPMVLLFLYLLLFVVMGHLVYLSSVVTHELGHMIAIKLVKGSFEEFWIGTGNKLFQFKKLVIGSIPKGGSVKRLSSYTPNKEIFIALSGVMFNILIVIFLWKPILKVFHKVITGSVEEWMTLHAFEYVLLFYFLCVVIDLHNLIPMKVNNGLDSDGLIIKKMLKKKKEEKKKKAV